MPYDVNRVTQLLEELSKCEGGMVNGNQLAARAKEILGDTTTKSEISGLTNDRLTGLDGLSAEEICELNNLREAEFEFLQFAAGQGYDQLFYRMPTDPVLSRATRNDLAATAEDSGSSRDAELRRFAGAPSKSKVLSILASLRLIFARAVSRGHHDDYFDTEQIWLGRPADTPARSWEGPVLGRSDLLGWRVPQPMVKRMYQRVVTEMREAGLVDTLEEGHQVQGEPMGG